MSDCQSHPCVVIPDDFPALFTLSDQMERLRALVTPGEVRGYVDRAGSEADLVQRLRGAAAVINMRSFTRFSESVLRGCPELRLISVSGTGTDNIDLDAATRLGIRVCNTPDANSVSVAEHTWALLMALCRGLREMETRMRAGEWWHHYGVELRGKTLGLIGLGRIGRRVARMAAGFEMRVVAWSLTRDDLRARECGVELVELDQLLQASDLVSLHLRLSDRTQGLLGDRELKLMKPGALLVNTARGALVDEAALVVALQSGLLGGAALDCYSQEPLPAEHPLRSTPNTLLIPHAGWMTAEARARMLSEPVDNLEAWLRGDPQNLVA